jgi:hypothetical protein
MSYAATARAPRARLYASIRPATPPATQPSTLPPIATIVANTLEAVLGVVMLSGVSLVLCTIAAAAIL